MSAIRWGILGCGSIANKFATGLQAADDAELVAVGSRTQENADAFADKYGAPRRHASYEALAADPDVDAIYVATPHVFHKANSMLCLRAGKAVLCEKPITINAADTAELVACAREEGVFLMEAMWTRFLPAIVKVRELIAEGKIGEVQMVKADFCFRSGWNPEGRLLNPALGGGGLLDVGIYPVALSHMVFGGPPADIKSTAHLGETGVDELAAMLLGFGPARVAVLTCGVRAGMPHEAYVVGTEGWIRINIPWWCTQSLTLGSGWEVGETLEFPHKGNGYEYEAEEVGRCLRAGKLESDVMPLDESVAILGTLDALRAQWGLRYPAEQ